ncbi:hypothetical protein LCGC14_0995590 [marine sediment metagenome]|uniref:Uncharacterized protein n=1 Tax=marine sediment metagenome TaxID=412755 RepID=A0A0F9RAU0_9ZZZZ
MAKPIRNEDVERSLINHIAKEIVEGVSIDTSGERFEPEKHREWIEPRIGTLIHEQQSRPDEEFARMDLVVRCFVKVEQKGRRRLDLSILVDKVLDVLGGERQVNAAIIRLEDKTDVGRIQFGSSEQSRAFGTAITVAGVSIIGLDVATILIPTLVTGDP